ncbi:hypothetical protein Ddc_02446 [Ditylenchus destructor]|nr:hypothetical protein Ddc_02446 [Ditylenchus destructor]
MLASGRPSHELRAMSSRWPLWFGAGGDQVVTMVAQLDPICRLDICSYSAQSPFDTGLCRKNAPLGPWDPTSSRTSSTALTFLSYEPNEPCLWIWAHRKLHGNQSNLHSRNHD